MSKIYFLLLSKKSMEVYNYTVNNNTDIKIEDIRKNLDVQHFIDLDLDIINSSIVANFHNNKGYIPLSVKIIDKTTNIMYGFILVGNKSILENKELQSKLYMYEDGFSNYLSSLNGCYIIGYGFDDKVIDKFWFNKMVKQICFSVQQWYNDKFEKLVYDYIWLDCPLDKIVFIRHKYSMESLENNANLIYKLLKK